MIMLNKKKILMKKLSHQKGCQTIFSKKLKISNFFKNLRIKIKIYFLFLIKIERRAKRSRKRVDLGEDKNISSINDKNKLFNEKLERFFGKYAADIKSNLERGTAI